MKKIIPNLCCLLLVLSGFLSFAQKQNSSSGFIENKGQIIDQKGRPNPAVKYLLNTNGLNIQLRENGFSYDIYQIKKHLLPQKNQKNDLEFAVIDPEKNLPKYNSECIYQRIDIDFENSNAGARIFAEGKSADFDNYYNLKHAPAGITEVYRYSKVTYENIYDNIDVVFFIPSDVQKPVEYNFIIRPGGKIGDIRLKFKGAQTDLFQNKIRMHLSFGDMEETLPMSWTESGNNKEILAVVYTKLKKNVYGFEAPQTNDHSTIIIDPVPIRLWGTYYGGTGDEMPSTMITNPDNDIYIAGVSESTTNIATAGTHQSNLIWLRNTFIAKLNSSGQRIWGTYIYYENGTDVTSSKLAVDANDNLYLMTEEHYGTNVATPGAYQPVKSNYFDIILFKFNSVGLRVWATYYGGTNNESAGAICLDNAGNVYIGGGTNSPDVFASPGAHQLTNSSQGDYQDAFLAKFTPEGQRVWGTFYGGIGSERIYSLFLSNDGFIYATGQQNSPTGIATPGSYQDTYTSYGGMIVKFDQDGHRIWGTYIGDSCQYFNSVFHGGYLYLAGQTYTSSPPLGPPEILYNSFQPVPPGSMLNDNANNFIVKFDVNTQQKVWGTYFNEYVTSFAVNSNEEIVFGGATNSDSGISTPDGFVPVKEPYTKVFFIKINSLGQKIWGSYYGGNGGAQVPRIVIDNAQDILLYGLSSGATTGISTPGAHQEIRSSSNNENFLAKFRDCMSVTTVTSDSPVCAGNTLHLYASGGTGYLWNGPNGFMSTDQNPTIINANNSHGGQYFCAITGTADCDNTLTVAVFVGDNIKPVPVLATLPDIIGDCNTTVTIPAATDNCMGNIAGTTIDPLYYNTPGTYIIHWNYNDGNGNVETQNQKLIINAVELPVSVTPQNFCKQQNATLNDLTITGQDIKWYDAPTSGNLIPHTAALINGNIYFASQTIDNCESQRISVNVNIQDTPAPIGPSIQTFCSTQNATLHEISVTGSNLIWYDSAAGTTVNPESTMLVDGTTYYATQNINSCESTERLVVTVVLTNTLNASDYSETICDDANDGFEKTDLSIYNSHLISNPNGCLFEYYQTLSGAASQNPAELISLFSEYNLELGVQDFFIRIISTNSCSQIVQLSLNLVSEPIIPILDTVSICSNSSITVSAGSNSNSYLWSDNSTSSSITVSEAGSYSVTVTKNHGLTACSSTKNFNVVLSDQAVITNIDTQDWTETENIITVNVNGLGKYEFSIDGIHYQDSNIFSHLISGVYSVFVKDKNGCGITKQDVYLMMYPLFFTPNGDGINDTWSIKCSSFDQGMKVYIFDRYGKVITSLDHLHSWDGKYKDYDLPSTDYWFVAILNDGKEYKGHFTLKR